MPDLVVSALSVNPTGVAAGGQATVTFTVLNQGNTAAPSTVAKIRLGSVTTMTDQDPLLADVTVPSLGVGQFQTLSPQPVAIPSGTAAGSYYVGVVANGTGVVQESDRTNNQRVTPLTVTSAAIAPEIFQPNWAPVVVSGTSQTLTVTGRNFDSNAIVAFRNPAGISSNATTVSRIGTTAITVDQVFAVAGKWSVIVTNSSGHGCEYHFSVVDAGTIDGCGYPIDKDKGWCCLQDFGEFYGDLSRGGGLHSGEDWNWGGVGDDIGKPVYAIANGTVVFMHTTGATNSLGWTIVIQHHVVEALRTKDYYSVYSHITFDKDNEEAGVIAKVGEESKFSFSVGQSVSQGKIIGRIANMPSSHLHFEIRTKVGTDRSTTRTFLYSAANKNYYYSNEDREVLAHMTAEQRSQAIAIMQAEGSTDPSDFIYQHRHSQVGVSNGSFAGATLAYWGTSGHGTVSIEPLNDVCVARLTTASPANLYQSMTTPDESFDLTFDYQFQTTTGTLDVLLNSMRIATIAAPSSLSGSPSAFRATVSDSSLLSQQDAVLDFHFDGLTNSQIDLTHIAIEAAPPSAYASTEEITTAGGTPQDISVIYTDSVAIDVSTFGTGDVSRDRPERLQSKRNVCGR